MTRRLCKLDGCERISKHASRLCATHEGRRKRGAQLDVPIRPRRLWSNITCSRPECEKPTHANSYCKGHSYQWSKHGYTWPIKPRGIFHRCSYSAAHSRVRSIWGSASKYSCVRCGEAAIDWAYDGTDEHELEVDTSTGGVMYSRYPEFYMPMCRRCHKNFDMERLAALKQEFFKWRTQKSAS